MKKLSELVDIVENNENCVILQVKDNSRLDLIKLGCFNGEEDILRITKGRNHTFTVFEKNGKSYSWEHGESGYTLVTEERDRQRELLIQCIVADFDIYIGADKDKINATLRIKSLEDTKSVIHEIKIMYWNKQDKNIVVHKDNEYYDTFSSIQLAKEHFEDLGYTLQTYKNYVAKTGCFVERYVITKK